MQAYFKLTSPFNSQSSAARPVQPGKGSAPRRMRGNGLRVLLCVLVCVVSFQLLGAVSKAAKVQRLLPVPTMTQCVQDCDFPVIEDIAELRASDTQACNDETSWACEPDQHDRDVMPSSYYELAIENAVQRFTQLFSLPDPRQRPLLRPPRMAA